MAGLRMVDADTVLPNAIEHHCEQMFDGTTLTQSYNYVVYHFEKGGCYYWARAYVEDIATVALFGPLDGRATRKPLPGPPDDGVLDYLKRRFNKIQALGETGYTILWRHR